MKKRILAGLFVALAVVLAACGSSSSSSSAGGAKKHDWTYAVITHAAPGDAFWDRVKSGAVQAGGDYGVTVTYNNDPDPVKQSQLIDNAVAKKVDGIVVSMANPQGLETSIKKAVAAGIPVVTINSGLEESKAYGAITHIGQSEEIAGKAVGERLKSEGYKNVLCVIQEAGNVGLETRCKAVKEALAGSGTVTNLQVDGTNDSQVQSTIKSKLQADSNIDAVLTLGGQYSIDAVNAVSESGSKAKVATFDLSEDVVKDIQSGKIEFAVDQQPYVQGYLGVTVLYLKDLNGNDVGGGLPINSGPAFVTKDNADQVLKFAENGTR